MGNHGKATGKRKKIKYSVLILAIAALLAGLLTFVSEGIALPAGATAESGATVTAESLFAGTGFTFTNDAAHPWITETKNGKSVLKTHIRGLDNTATSFTLSFNATSPKKLCLDYRVSCELYNDGFDIIFDNKKVPIKFTDESGNVSAENTTSGETYWNFIVLDFAAGSHTLNVKYRKGAEISAFQDACWFGVPRICAADAVYNASAKIEDALYGSVSGSTEGVAVGKTATFTVNENQNGDMGFAGWYDEAGFLMSEDATYTFAVTQNAAFTARFIPYLDLTGLLSVSYPGGEKQITENNTLISLPAGSDTGVCTVTFTNPDGLYRCSLFHNGTPADVTGTYSFNARGNYASDWLEIKISHEGYLDAYANVYVQKDFGPVSPDGSVIAVNYYIENIPLWEGSAQNGESVVQIHDRSSAYSYLFLFATGGEKKILTFDWAVSVSNSSQTYFALVDGYNGKETLLSPSSDGTFRTAELSIPENQTYSFYFSFFTDPGSGRSISLKNIRTVQGDMNVSAAANDPALGRVTSSAAGQVAAGASVTVEAEANADSVFIGWYNARGSLVSVDRKHTFTVTEDTALTAEFLKPAGANTADAPLDFSAVVGKSSDLSRDLNLGIDFAKRHTKLYLKEIAGFALYQDGTLRAAVNGIYVLEIEPDTRLEFRGEKTVVVDARLPGAGIGNIRRGYGTEEKPYVIEDAADLYLIKNHSDKFFILADTMTYSGFPNNVLNGSEKTVTLGAVWTPIGAEAAPFRGGFDGNGWKIVVGSVASSDQSGMFGCVSNAIIQNFLLEITHSDGNSSYFGGIAGIAKGATSIRNVTVTVRFTDEAGNPAVFGGLIGDARNENDLTPTVTDCFVHGKVRNTGAAATAENTGGLGNGGHYTNCIVDAEIIANGLAGGLTGGHRKDNVVLNNCWFAGTLTGTGEYLNNYPYIGIVNGYGALNMGLTSENSGQRLKITYDHADRVEKVEIFNNEFGEAVTGGYCNIVLKTTFADTGLLDETKINGVTGNYGGFVVRFTMKDGTFKYVSTLDRSCFTFRSEINVKLDELTSYTDNFASLTIDTAKGTSGYKVENGVSIFGAVTVTNANDFEHLAWLVNGGIPVTIGGKYYNARSVTTLSVALGADVDLTADRIVEIGGNTVCLNRNAGRLSGGKLNLFYGFGMSEMLPYRGSLYGEGHTITVDMDFPDSYLMGVIAIGSDMDGTVTLKDLTVRGKIVGKNRVGLVGMFDGYMRSGSIRFSGVEMRADVTAAGKRAAAFLGEIHAARITFENCFAGSIVSGGIAGVFLGGNTHGYTDIPGWTFSGTNYNNTNLKAIYGEEKYTGAISDESVKRRVAVRYGHNDNEFVVVEISNAEDTATVSSILSGGVVYAFGAPVVFSVFENGAFCKNEFFVFVFKGSLTKQYDGTPDFGFGAENYLGNWNGAEGTLTASGADASDTAYTAFTTEFVPPNGAATVFAGIRAAIEKRAVSVTIEIPSELVYNGRYQPLTVTANHLIGDAASQYLVEYKYGNENVAEPFGSGDYTVTVTIKDEFRKNYVLGADSALRKSFTIKPLKITVAMPDGYATQKNYGAAEPVWNGVIVDGAESAAGVCERVPVSFVRKDFAANQDVAVYPDAVAVFSSDKNYEVGLASPVTFEIVKTAPVVTLPGASRPYNGDAFVMTGASVTGAGAIAPNGEVSYRFYSDAACLTEISAPSDAGEYYVKAFSAEDARYLAGESEAAAIAIAKAELTVGVKATALKIFKGQALSQSAVTGGFVGIGGEAVRGGWSWRGADELPAETQTYTAVFTPTSLNYNEKEVPLTVTVERLTVTFEGIEPAFFLDYGATFPLADFPAVPGKAGYSGVWSETGDITDVRAHITVSSVYQPVSYRLIYILDGGGVSGNPETYTVETDTFLLKAPVREGHTFTGWTYGSVAEPETAVFVAKGSTGDRTFTAHYTVNRYAVTFTAVNGSVSAAPAIASGDSVAFGEVVTFSCLADAGYKFTGWFVDGVESGSDAAFVFTVPAKDCAIEARFAALTDIRYTVRRYKQNPDGKSYGAPETETYYGKTGARVAAPAKHYEGFTPPLPMPSGIVAGDGGLTLEVYYTRNLYNVSFDGADFRSYRFGQTFPLPEARIKPGFLFDGWKKPGAETAFLGEFTVPSSDTAFTSVYTLVTPEIAVSGYTSPVTYGTRVTLNANATHALPVVFQWYRDGVSMETETGGTLVLSEVADSGNYSVKVTVSAENQTKSAESARVAVEIRPAEMSVSAKAYNAQYDGAAHGITVEAPDGAKTEFSLDRTNWSDVNPSYSVPAETVTVYYRVSKTNFTTFESNATVTVLKRKITAELLPQGSEYDGTEPAVDQTKYRMPPGSLVEGDDLKIRITKESGSKAGVYALSAAWDNERYEVVFKNSESNLARFTVSPRAVTVALSSQRAEYDGTEPAVDQTEYKIESGSMAAGEDLRLTLVKSPGVDAGVYALTAAWDNPNADAANYSITYKAENFTITPAALTVTIYDQTTVYSEAPVELTYCLEGTVIAGEDLPFILSLVDQNGLSAQPLNADAGVYRIVGAAVSQNYAVTFAGVRGGAEGSYTVAKKGVSLAAVSFADTAQNGRIEVLSDGSAHLPRPLGLPEGVRAVYRIDNADGAEFSGAASGSHTLHVLFVADPNHEITGDETEKTIEFAVIVMRVNLIWKLENRYEFTGSDQSAKISAVFVDEAGTERKLTSANGGIKYNGGNAFRDAGTYEVEAVVPERYGMTAESKPTFTIVLEKRILNVDSVVFEDSSAPYTGGLQKIEIKGVLPEGAGVRYTLNGEAYAGAKDAGTYRVEAELFLTDGQNYVFSDGSAAVKRTAVQTISDIADAEQAFRDAVAGIGDAGIDSYGAIADAMEMYFALSYQGNVTEAKAAMDKAVEAYNEAVRAVNDAHWEAAEISGAPIAAGLGSTGLMLTLMALGFALKRRLL